jgi:hypothetical protein
MSILRGMAWTVVAVVALVLVLWNCEGSKAEGASGSHAGISNSSEGGTGCARIEIVAAKRDGAWMRAGLVAIDERDVSAIGLKRGKEERAPLCL